MVPCLTRKQTTQEGTETTLGEENFKKKERKKKDTAILREVRKNVTMVKTKGSGYKNECSGNENTLGN